MPQLFKEGNSSAPRLRKDGTDSKVGAEVEHGKAKAAAAVYAAGFGTRPMSSEVDESG